ncbi:hypothetical protein HDV06_002854 [Boothiomyces sp. JEL0866]|nr:hypothetical protein HDV06_002854 [Boothiomyces sp. JEL0866]
MQVDQLVFYSSEILKTSTADTDAEISSKVVQSMQYLEYALQLNPQPSQRIVVLYNLAILHARYTENKEQAARLITKGMLDSKVISNEYYTKFSALQNELYMKKPKTQETLTLDAIDLHVSSILNMVSLGDYRQALHQLPSLHAIIEKQSSVKWYIIGYILSSLVQCKTDIKKAFLYLNEGRKYLSIESKKQKTFLDPIAMYEYKSFLSRSSHYMNLLFVDLYIATSDYISAFNILEGMEMDECALFQLNRLFRILNIAEIGESRLQDSKTVANLKEAMTSTNSNETKKIVFETINTNQDHQLNAIALFILGDLYKLTTPNLSVSSYQKSKYLCDLVE